MKKRLRDRVPCIESQRGQVMVLFALMLPILIGMLGIGIDAAHLFQSRRGVQSAADLAALAGASQLPGDPGSAQSIARDIAAQNGFSDGVSVAAPYGGDDQKIEVQISSEVDTFFMKALGIASVTVSARSVASHEVTGFGAIVAKKDYHCWEGTVTIAGSNIAINGSVHSNGGLDLRNSSNNTITGKLTYKRGEPEYLLDHKTDCGDELYPLDNPTAMNPGIEIDAAPWQDWPVLYTGADFPCTYNLGTNGDLERDGPWWKDGTMLPDKQLNPGVICVSGSTWLTLDENDVSGNVTFRGGRIDIRGSNTNFTAYDNGVLFVSDYSTDFPAMRLYPSGGRWEGTIYNRNWNTSSYVEGSQIRLTGSSGFQHVGNIVGWAVYLDGSNWTLSGTDSFDYEPMRIVE